MQCTVSSSTFILPNTKLCSVYSNINSLNSIARSSHFLAPLRCVLYQYISISLYAMALPAACLATAALLLNINRC